MSTFVSFAGLALPPLTARPWLASRNTLPFRGIQAPSIGRGERAAGNGTPQAAASADRHASSPCVSPAKLLKGAVEIEVDDALPSLSIGVLNQLADRIGIPAREAYWIAPIDAEASAVRACPGLSLYVPRTPRESIWAIEQAIAATDARAVAAWLPHLRSGRSQSELRLLRRLRALAARHCKTVVLLRYWPATIRAERAFAVNQITAAV